MAFSGMQKYARGNIFTSLNILKLDGREDISFGITLNNSGEVEEYTVVDSNYLYTYQSNASNPTLEIE